jgi:hypothetical protein
MDALRRSVKAEKGDGSESHGKSSSRRGSAKAAKTAKKKPAKSAKKLKRAS